MAEESVVGPQAAMNKLTDWANEPELASLKADLEIAKEVQTAQIAKVQHWNDLRDVKGSAKPRKVKGRSEVQPKLIRRQAEWRYSALTEPFLATKKLWTVKPSTFEDTDAARQNELLINYQFRTKFNRVKFIDDLVRSTVDDGTAIIRTGWIRETKKVKTTVPIWNYYPPQSEEQIAPIQQALELQASDPHAYNDTVPDEIKASIDYYNETGQTAIAQQGGTTTQEVEQVICNHPTAEVLSIKNVFIDPTCGGDLKKAMFVVVSFETCKADLLKEGKRYKNLDAVNWEGATPLADPDHQSVNKTTLSLKGIRKRVVAYEYWGFYEINNDGKLLPFVATWIGDTLIRMELNPFPDEKLPFILIPYSPVKGQMYGEPDAEILEDQQRIAGAVTRGMIDLLGKSANGQQGFAKGMLDPLNRRRFENGQDYEFNPNVPVQSGYIQHKYPELPASAMQMLQLQNNEAEALTGIKAFAGGMSGDTYGDVAKGIGAALDAAAKREMAILRRVAHGIIELGEKFSSMNEAFLSEEEVVRVTNEKFITVKREEIKGNFDFEVDISTAEVDNAKAQDLAFMLQTIGPDEDPEMRHLILAEIAELKKMPDLAHKIRTYQPKPDPMKQQMMQLQIEELQSSIDKNRAEAELARARAGVQGAEESQKRVDTAEQMSGTAHEREVEKMEAQSEGNQNLEVTKALLKPGKEGESKPNVEAAVGFNHLTQGHKTGAQPSPIQLPGSDADQDIDPILTGGPVDQTQASPGLV